MPRIPGTTNAQTIFLRAFRRHPAGPPPEDWPSPAIVRRWLRRPAFLSALADLREVLRFRTDFHLTLAASQAAEQLQSPPTGGSALDPQDHKRLLNLLRLAHVRQRFSMEKPDLDPPSRDDRNGGDETRGDGTNTRPKYMT
jgi:hypothetical protein